MGSSKSSDLSASTAHALSRLGVKPDSSLLVAASGGVDSMTLVFILNELRKHGHLKRLGVIHINHKLRATASDKDEAIVRKICKKLKILVHVFAVDTKAWASKNKIGIEEAARDIRYEKIASVASAKKFEFVATAHTANDQTETVLMNIVRGAGLNGLQGIPESRRISSVCTLIRPLLGANKSDLRSFAKKNKIPFREDASNSSLEFQRNRVRHIVLPALQDAFKGRDIYAAFTKVTQNLASVAGYVNAELQELQSKAALTGESSFIQRKMSAFNRKILLEAPAFLRRQLILEEASRLCEAIVSLDQVHSVLLESYLQYPSEKSFSLTQEIILTHEGKSVTIELLTPPPQNTHRLLLNSRVVTPVGIITAKKVKGWEKPENANTAYFRYEEPRRQKLLIRFWTPGDKIRPFGMNGKSRLVSDILGEAGIKTERLKYFVPLIVLLDEPEHIIWIPGIRSAEYGRLSAKSETALQLKRKM